jgi:hypothetical protein
MTSLLRVAVQIDGTGILMRLATEDESLALAQGTDLGDVAGGSYEVRAPDHQPSSSEVDVVLKTFVEFRRDGRHERWEGFAYYGFRVPTDRDATLDLLKLAGEVDLIDLLADLRIAGLGVSRWEFFSAPHRLELDAELDQRLAPRQRG